MTQNEKTDMILSVVHAIPSGEVLSYGEVAKQAGLTGYARYVGFVLKSLPNDSTIPWHRVINAKQKISFPPQSEAYLAQSQRLQSEGHDLTTDGRIKKK
jgi:methylated-DNA-protein-cysteine methyltransferase-like protein